MNKRTPEYAAWLRMKHRCFNPANKDFAIYGGRGITVCEKWRHDFAAFLADLGSRPSQLHSLDRVDSNGHYEPSNCRWATAAQQVRGRRKAHRITLHNETLSLMEWAVRLSVSYGTLARRLERNSVEEAFTMEFGRLRGHRFTSEEARRAGARPKNPKDVAA